MKNKKLILNAEGDMVMEVIQRQEAELKKLQLDYEKISDMESFYKAELEHRKEENAELLRQLTVMHAEYEGWLTHDEERKKERDRYKGALILISILGKKAGLSDAIKLAQQALEDVNP